MRVIAGKARRILLETPEGMDTRPTTDRIKETLFNMLQNDLYDASFLDLYSGSGAIGIEALSRGAAEAVFVEKDPRALECIRKNLQTTRLADQAQVKAGDVVMAIRGMKGRAPFDYIFLDPPYAEEAEGDVLAAIADAGLADEYTCIIVEATRQRNFDFVSQFGFEIRKEKEYKTNKHVFLSRIQEEIPVDGSCR